MLIRLMTIKDIRTIVNRHYYQVHKDDKDLRIKI
jgi:hypothetical protein